MGQGQARTGSTIGRGHGSTELSGVHEAGNLLQEGQKALIFGVKGQKNILRFTGDCSCQGSVGGFKLPELDLGLVGKLSDL